jgi:hypothetical protein
VVARRLLIFVAVLMGLTALAAGLATPPPRAPKDTEGPVIGTSVKPATPPVEATLSLSEPRTIAVDEGDQLQLSVQGDALDAVEIAGLGQLQAIAPDTPAAFDILADRAGTYPIRLLGADRRVGRLRVTPARE